MQFKGSCTDYLFTCLSEQEGTITWSPFHNQISFLTSLSSFQVSSFQKPLWLNVKFYQLRNVMNTIRTLIQMASSAQMMLSADKSSATPSRASLSEHNYSKRALRTYLQQSRAHSSLEPPLQSLLSPSKSARAMRHQSSRPFQSGALLISLWEGAAAPSSSSEQSVMFSVCCQLRAQPSKCPD